MIVELRTGYACRERVSLAQTVFGLFSNLGCRGAGSAALGPALSIIMGIIGLKRGARPGLRGKDHGDRAVERLRYRAFPLAPAALTHSAW
ncbi:hypothetical protein CKO19_16320 [Rhodovulum adriaticum]|nr:hypothetical protein [Rhodovulum adriaticum]